MTFLKMASNKGGEIFNEILSVSDVRFCEGANDLLGGEHMFVHSLALNVPQYHSPQKPRFNSPCLRRSCGASRRICFDPRTLFCFAQPFSMFSMLNGGSPQHAGWGKAPWMIIEPAG